MSEAAEQPHYDQLGTAARALSDDYEIGTGAPRALRALEHLQDTLLWVDRLPEKCRVAEPQSSKAAEWLLDNQYQIKRAVRLIDESLPAAYYRQLPRLENSQWKALPRVLCLAQAYLGTTQIQLSLTGLVEFVRAFQENTPLTIAELWALPTMLRLVCLDLLIMASKSAIPELTPPYEEQTFSHLLALHEPTEDIARAITTLRVISSIPWKEFFDRTSRVEEILLEDPSGIYASMDFDTRDSYRKIIEELARSSVESEWSIAERVLEQAESSPHDGRQDHVGYWLHGVGRYAMQAILNCRPAFAARAQRFVLRNAGRLYALALLSFGFVALLLPTYYLWANNATVPVLTAGIALSLAPASIISITIVHWVITLTIPPRILPKLDFEGGISPLCQTAVVVPVIVGTEKEVPALIERLELHWLSNPDPMVQIVLLSDPKDASAERTPDDSLLETALSKGVRELNARHGSAGRAPFHLLHRSRIFNPLENCWMAWERKRGKLEQFNQLVLGEQIDAFPLKEGKTESLLSCRFVVTVDADTILPAGSVARLVSTLAHPLNAPEIDQNTGRLRAGYTIIQPRVEISPESGCLSLFSHFFGGDSAIDIYSRAVSNVYQDLFGSASYVGKGIYDVASFQHSLHSRATENSLLSHDLFEGAHGRVALASDIVLYDDFPASYVEYSHRWHRWVRGDWQLLPWLAPRVPTRGGARKKSEISGLDRWKIFDNLRRSVIPVSLVLLAIAGWIALPGNAWVWTALTIAAPGAYLFTDIITGLARGRRRGTLRNIFLQLVAHLGRWFFALVFLLQDALLSLDAITRTLWRVFVSRRKLLTWTSAAHTAAHLGSGNLRATAWREMWVASVVAAFLAVTLFLTNPASLFSASPLLLLWLAAPEIAAWISRPRTTHITETLGHADRVFLRKVARRTWFFFESFVGPEDNWLPPDNFQNDPQREIAHRTSPTNIGMYLISALTAWDLGHIDSSNLAARVENCLDSLKRLERYRGHLLNWYDTRNLNALEPRYVSTVDSGNLAVCLITLKEGCEEAAKAPAINSNQWDGLVDNLSQLTNALDRLPGHAGELLRELLQSISDRALQVRDQPAEWYATLTAIFDTQWSKITGAVAPAITPENGLSPEILDAIQLWLDRTEHHLQEMQRSFELLFPWLAQCENPALDCNELARRTKELLNPSLSLAECKKNVARAFEVLNATEESETQQPGTKRWIADMRDAIEQGTQRQHDLRQSLLESAKRAESFAYEMEFEPLYDSESRLFHIGYNVSSDRLDPHYYDLLASEARLASYFAIAKRDVPAEHWFWLGRPIANPAGAPSLLSWNGSMFEYLMPPIFLRSLPGTLLSQSERAAVEVQRRYARASNTPWGVSESGYSARDSHHLYQYQAFGVPGLGLRRGLAQDVVVAPYATALALAVNPLEAVRNLKKLAKLGLLETYGFLEAADFTPERVPNGRALSPVRAHMAHHQGMILAAIGNALGEDIHVRRFSSDLRMQTVHLLLQERVPWELPPDVTSEEGPLPEEASLPAKPAPRPWRPENTDTLPQMHMLGNGRFASWISHNGGGALWWHEQALTRWLPDATRDNNGLWVYVLDEDTGAIWSVGRQPTGSKPTDEQVVFHPHLAEFHRREAGIGVRMEVCVAPSDDVEIRRITVTNETDQPRNLRIVSYGEVALSPAREDERHLSFSKLFVGSEHVISPKGLLFVRRSRNLEEHPATLFHGVVLDDRGPISTNFESDRRAFLGRNSKLRRPHGVTNGLSGTVGWTLDPVMALELKLPLKPRETRQFALLTLAAGSRETAFELADRYATLSAIEWAFNDAVHEAGREARELDLEPERFAEFQALSSLLLAPRAPLRSPVSKTTDSRQGQPRLWAMGLSGDLPILLLRVNDAREVDILRQLLRAQKLWRNRLFPVDLVILLTNMSGYEEPARERALTLIREARAYEMMGRSGGIHMLFADQVTAEDRTIINAAASVVLDSSSGLLANQISRAFETRASPPRFEPTGAAGEFQETPISRPTDLQFDNGLGGFSADGSEYVIHLRPGEYTPAPWCNILANDGFGCMVSEAGGGFTWAVNSGENRLTPWTNDPLLDPQSEVLYLRDEETGEIWTPTPAPIGSENTHQIRHGLGYTKWLSNSHGLEHELTVFVVRNAPVKIIRLRLRNAKPAARRITATYYAEWLLGALRSVSRRHVVSRYDAYNRALVASSAWNPEFASRVAFLASSHPPHSITTDRQEFIGLAGDLSRPAGLERWDLGGRTTPDGEPCAAFQVHLDIDANGEEEIIFVLGQGNDQAHTTELSDRWRKRENVDHAFADLKAYWHKMLEQVQVQTPDPAFDLMVNRWFLYQTISSRILARAGPYQANGAIGFRDQLQDVLALLHCDPARARAHILRCARRQFEEGDVLHWWHPPNDRGVRTRCSDDLLWLPYVTDRYVEATGDVSILEEDVPFLSAPELASDESDRFSQFEETSENYSLFEHCLRAMQRGITRGERELPLMGAGDWNDGMNRVGAKGHGESIWLGWFAIAAIKAFSNLAIRVNREVLADTWVARASEIQHAIERSGWDGKWYLRAYDDDGRPWGSASCEECKIDSISQSWAVLSGAPVTTRTHTAMESVMRELVRDEDRLLPLLRPPFHKTYRDPGYIKAYPPGIRENGGQYSHAAAWCGIALARLGDGDRAKKIFDFLNPIQRSASKSEAEHYRVEPYVLSADIGGSGPQAGLGGWTWYTGAAAWTWRLAVEEILGLRFYEGGILIDPHLPKDWAHAHVTVKGEAGSIAISIENPDHLERNAAVVTVDDVPLEEARITFPTEDVTLNIRVRLIPRSEGK